VRPQGQHVSLGERRTGPDDQVVLAGQLESKPPILERQSETERGDGHDEPVPQNDPAIR
jgi:hypothetical protein